MSLAYVVAKFIVNMFIFIYTLAAILDFANLDICAIPFFLDFHDILYENQVKNQF